MKPHLSILAAVILSGCVQTAGSSTNGFSPAVSQLAEQRIRFMAEAVCLNNTTPRAQRRAAERLDFLVPTEDEPRLDPGAIGFASPGTATSIRIGPVPPQTFRDDEGNLREVRGSGCSVGSPAVSTDRANRLIAEILAPRLLDNAGISAPLGGGTNEDGGVGFFFEGLAVTLPTAQTPFTDPRTGQDGALVHPIILVVHY